MLLTFATRPPLLAARMDQDMLLESLAESMDCELWSRRRVAACSLLTSRAPCASAINKQLASCRQVKGAAAQASSQQLVLERKDGLQGSVNCVLEGPGQLESNCWRIRRSGRQDPPFDPAVKFSASKCFGLLKA